MGIWVNGQVGLNCAIMNGGTRGTSSMLSRHYVWRSLEMLASHVDSMVFSSVCSFLCNLPGFKRTTQEPDSACDAPHRTFCKPAGLSRKEEACC